jgi:hypothetical protein
MPRATVSTEAIRYDLQSLPDGFVSLKQLSFGEMLQRRDRGLRYTQEMTQGNGNAAKMQIDILNEFSRLHDFPRCIVDHNLEDDQGNKLDFGERMIKMTLAVLDPKIGSEIERLIDKLNQDEFDPEDFTTPAGSPSTTTGSTP